MLTKVQNWSFYEWTTGAEGKFDTPDAFHLVKTIRRVWPVPEFQALADKLNYPYVERDNTLVGGYFVNGSGECLVCVPEGMPPERVYL